MPPRRAVELRVGGQTYRVVASDNDQHVQRLADLVDRKFAEVVPHGRGVTGQQAMFLIAMALAEEAEEQRTRAARLEVERDRSLHLAARARDVVARLLKRVDSVLSALPAETSKGSPPPIVEPHIVSPLDRITDPPDAMHEPVLIELLPPSGRETTWNSSSPTWLDDEAKPPASSAPLSATEKEAPISRPKAPGHEAGIARNPRPGLRLVRRSSTDDEPR
jgi:cell division protein ZapA